MPTVRDTDLVDPIDDLLGYQLRRASAFAMADLAAELTSLRLRPAEASMLFLIAANPGVTQSEVGRLLGIQRANMAPLIASLAKRKLIERKPVDGRSQALRLSASGRALRDQAWRGVQTHERRVFGVIPSAERRSLITLFKALRATPDTRSASQ